MTNLQTPAPARDSRENEMSLDRNNFFIGNEWVRPASDRRFKIHNSSTGEHVATVPEGVEADVDAAVAAARQAFDHSPWPRLKPAEREIGRAHVRTPVTNAHLVCRLLLATKTQKITHTPKAV